MGRRLMALVAGMAGIAGMAAAQTPMSWPELIGRPHPTGAVKIAYGRDPLQFGELWLPATGAAPHPLVLMTHGGCWQSDVADRRIMDWAAADLAARGIAVWNIEYRGVDRRGGGYPGTFLDVAEAADALRRIAPAHALDLAHVVAVGHSAGGHLALWLAARPRLPRASALRTPGAPLPIAAVVSLGGLPDLKAARDLPGNDCGVSGVPPLVGKASAARGDVFADTSLPSLLPLHVAQTMIHGALDRIAPPSLGRGYVAAAQARHETVGYVEIPQAGHVELIAPGTRAWIEEVRVIEAALGKR